MSIEHPILYEINTRCWLHELSVDANRRITLDSVPDDHFAHWREHGFTHIWLMGVWTVGRRSRDYALQSPELRREYDLSFPGWKPEHVHGSPYSIADYKVSRALGGESGLKKFRAKLRQVGIKLILDFVPNHVGLDHPWVTDHPERFVQSETSDATSFIGGSQAYPVRLCFGRDPYFDPWKDTVQLDYRRRDTRTAMINELSAIAKKCDGVRCDMAMLLIDEIFAETWSGNPCRGEQSTGEFWPEAIREAKGHHKGFLFLAEAYWEREHELVRQGFDFAYQKKFTDAVFEHRELVQSSVLNTGEWIESAAHFLENHDEPRVASKLNLEAHRAAALAQLSLPGMRFLHEGQLQGRKIWTPVQLAVRAGEEDDPKIQKLYQILFSTIEHSSIGRGTGTVLPPLSAWDENDTHKWMLLIKWQSDTTSFTLVVANFAPHRSHCYVPLNVANIASHNWQMGDLLSEEQYQRSGEDLQSLGLFLDVGAYAAQCFNFTAVE